MDWPTVNWLIAGASLGVVLATFAVTRWNHFRAKAIAGSSLWLKEAVESQWPRINRRIWLSIILSIVGILISAILLWWLGHDKPWFAAFQYCSVYWVKPASQSFHLVAACKNAIKFLEQGATSPPYVLYLRDFEGEKVTVMRTSGGERPTASEVPFQPGAEVLRKIIKPSAEIIALWDSRDARCGLPFKPVLSSETSWQRHVRMLAEHAANIAIDLGELSPGLEWEVLTLLGDPGLAQKTVLIKSLKDPSHSVEISALLDQVGFLATFNSRRRDAFDIKSVKCSASKGSTTSSP